MVDWRKNHVMIISFVTIVLTKIKKSWTSYVISAQVPLCGPGDGAIPVLTRKGSSMPTI